MNIPLVDALAMQQAAMTAHIFGIVLNSKGVEPENVFFGQGELAYR